MRLVRTTLSTPVGPMLTLASADALCALEFGAGHRMSRLEARLSRFYPPFDIEEGTNPVIAAVSAWLDAYFAGTSASVDALSLDARGTTFERKVWRTLLTIPTGETRSYGQVAAKAASTVLASRAVGLANGANPIAIIVPCHRVIGSDGSLTGYGGGLDRKMWLLEHEQRFWPTETSLSKVARPASGRATRESRQPRLEF